MLFPVNANLELPFEYNTPLGGVDMFRQENTGVYHKKDRLVHAALDKIAPDPIDWHVDFREACDHFRQDASHVQSLIIYRFIGG
jgi:hypothetical protein